MGTIDGTNRLSVLAETIQRLNAEIEGHLRTSFEKARLLGERCIEAKQLCGHGEWLPFLRRAGIPERSAQQYMQLARSGIKPETVADLGGLRKVLELIAARHSKSWEREPPVPRVPFAGNGFHRELAIAGPAKEVMWAIENLIWLPRDAIDDLAHSGELANRLRAAALKLIAWLDEQDPAQRASFGYPPKVGSSSSSCHRPVSPLHRLPEGAVQAPTRKNSAGPREGSAP